jgi:hypothetical protein
MNRLRPSPAILCAGLAVAALSALAQTSPELAAAQQRYEREVAACNSGALAAPAREACIRAAGSALDRVRGGPPADVAVPSADGRATIVAPEGSSVPSSSSEAMPSRDGRATIVQPADRSAPR